MNDKIQPQHSKSMDVNDVNVAPKLPVASIATDLSRQHLPFLAAATSENTRKAYRSAIRHYLAWGGLLPGDEASIIRYLVEHSKTLNSRTLALRLTALSQWHTFQGFVDPAATPTVRKTLLGIERLHGKPKRKAKALPIEDLQRVVENLEKLDSLKAKRDNALLQLGYFGAFRRSEIAGLRVDDIEWVSEGIVISLPRSKTDQAGKGITKAIPFGTGAFCPSRAIRAWLDTAKIESGALFRSISKSGTVSTARLHEGSVNTILANCAKLAGLDYVPQLSSHSLRRGMATSAHRAGADFRDIKRQGGWRHDGTVQGYIEEAGQFEDNAAGTLLRPKT